MLGHDDPTQQANVMLARYFQQSSDEQSFDSVVLQQWQAFIAGEGEKSRVAVVFDAM